MRTTTWNSTEFLYWYNNEASRTKKERAWADLSPRQRKLVEELDMFRRFAEAAAIKYEPDSELTLDPNSESPPPPDLTCTGLRGPLFFELGEVVEAAVAATSARAEREDWKVYGGPVALWEPLEQILLKKLEKRYSSQARPLDLILYYGVGRQAAFWPFLISHIEARKARIQEDLRRGPFDAVWLYDSHSNLVIARFTSSAVFIAAASHSDRQSIAQTSVPLAAARVLVR